MLFVAHAAGLTQSNARREPQRHQKVSIVGWGARYLTSIAMSTRETVPKSEQYGWSLKKQL